MSFYWTPTGEVVQCVRDDGYKSHLTAGRLYKVLSRAESGINSRRYTTVLGNLNKAVTVHQTRFVSIEEEDI